MAADEQQPQDVVAIVRAVEPLGQRGLGVVEVGDRLLVRQRRLPAAAGARRRSRRCGRPGSARRPDRAAGRSAARSSARAGRLPGRPPRRCRDRGNSAAARRSPGAAPRSAPARSRPRSVMPAASCRALEDSRRAGSRRRRPGLASAEFARDLERLVELGAVDDVEAEQLLLGLGERPVDHQRRSPSLRSVVAAVVGSSRATGPSRPCLGELAPAPPRAWPSPRRPPPWSRSRRRPRRGSRGWRRASGGLLSLEDERARAQPTATMSFPAWLYLSGKWSQNTSERKIDEKRTS